MPGLHTCSGFRKGPKRQQVESPQSIEMPSTRPRDRSEKIQGLQGTNCLIWKRFRAAMELSPGYGVGRDGGGGRTAKVCHVGGGSSRDVTRHPRSS